jgi:hypothetical protein
MKQSTTNNNKNENMKMRKKLIIALVLGACVGTQAFAAPAVYQTKEGVINFALTRQYQYQPNTTVFIPAPTTYVTKTAKITSASVIQAISEVLYGTPNHFTPKAVLILGKGAEMQNYYYNGALTPSTSTMGYYDNLNHNPELSGFFGTFDPSDWMFDASQNGNVALDNGRNHHLNTNSVNGEFVAAPTGLSEPWGQIWLKDTGQTDPVTGLTLCVNVTYFFDLQVQECYDCLYMNSFVSDAKFKNGAINGPPCCSPTITQSGSGVDKYYLTLIFDNTANNPHLNYNQWNDYTNEFYVDLGYYSESFAFPNYNGGLYETDDGVHPDGLDQNEAVGVDFHPYDTYTMRFTLNGILTYKWTLKSLNPGDEWPDFIGSATYPATGYGFVSKVCNMIDGTVTIAERLVADSDCCSVIDTITVGGSSYDGYYLSRGLYGELDGFYTDYFGRYHAFNDDIFYHPQFNNNYQDYKEWFETDEIEPLVGWSPGVVEEEDFFEGGGLSGQNLPPLLP